MREGLGAPTFELPAEKITEIRAFLDGQSRFMLAVWVRHEQQGAGGPLYDHHLVLAVADDDWAAGDMRALEDGMQLPALSMTEPTWIDIFPLSEVEALRTFGTVLWEQTSPGPDPLDYRFTHEPVAVPGQALQAFSSLVRDVAPEVVRVTARRSRLWKGETEIEDSTSLRVDCRFDRLGPPPGPLESVLEAAREAGIAHSGGSLGDPAERLTDATVLYEQAAER